MNTTTYRVAGMTCSHCAAAVTEEIAGLAGVTSVTVDLVGGGTSSVLVTAAEALTDDVVAAALSEAGDYQLVK